MNTTRKHLIEERGALTGEGILCRQSIFNNWEHIVKGDRRICNGYTDCLGGLDEESCSVLRVKVNSLPEVNITIEEVNRGIRTKGGIVCKDFHDHERWIGIREKSPRICNGINDCLSDMPVSLDEENCDIFHIKAKHFNLGNSILRACGTYPGGRNQPETGLVYQYNQCRQNKTFQPYLHRTPWQRCIQRRRCGVQNQRRFMDIRWVQ